MQEIRAWGTDITVPGYEVSRLRNQSHNIGSERGTLMAGDLGVRTSALCLRSEMTE
jgi:hypothetical protein